LALEVNGGFEGFSRPEEAKQGEGFTGKPARMRV
jgi:hypothetical protein